MQFGDNWQSAQTAMTVTQNYIKKKKVLAANLLKDFKPREHGAELLRYLF